MNIEPTQLQSGVWYKKKGSDRFILRYYTGDIKTYIGYMAGSWGLEWQGFRVLNQWIPVTKEEIALMGNQWKQYNWIDHEYPKPDMNTKLMNYKYCFVHDSGNLLLLLEDLKLPGVPSLTNTIQNAYNEIMRGDKLLPYPDYIFYCDSIGDWDQYVPNIDYINSLGYKSLPFLFEFYMSDTVVKR